MTREQIEQAVPRSSFEASIEAASQEQGPRRIKGTANSFRMMRSRRLIHPEALNAWLEKNDGRVPLLAQHGAVAGFATIGTATLRVSGSKLAFEGELISGTPLADEAWTLIAHGVLRTVSLGWVPRQSRWVTEGDPDLDEHVRRELRRTGEREAWLLRVIEPAELSLVDVPDDPAAVLAAAAQDVVAARLEACVGPLRDELQSLRAAVKDMAQALAGARSPAVEPLDAANVSERLAQRVMESIEMHFALLEAARDAYPVMSDGLAEVGGCCGTDVATPVTGSGASSAGSASPTLAGLIEYLRGKPRT